jgi:hypothetical protein
MHACILRHTQPKAKLKKKENDREIKETSSDASLPANQTERGEEVTVSLTDVAGFCRSVRPPAAAHGRGPSPPPRRAAACRWQWHILPLVSLGIMY